MATMMPLLTPSESLKFESALLSYSNGIAAQEWTMYTADGHEEFSEPIPPRREGSEQLARATKDLISLDTSSLRWNESADRDVLTANLPSSSPQNLPLKPLVSTSYAVPSPHPRLSSPLHQIFNVSPTSLQRPPLTIAPNRTLDSSAASDSQQSLSSVSSNTTPPPPTPPSLKRPYTASSDLSSLAGTSSSSSTSTSTSSSRQPSKKHRTSAPHQQGPVLNTKPSLLTPSQKKANHIQSEQKRRANIRRGYEALCETVPALREAILAEERELAEVADNESGAKGKSKKKNRGKRGLGDLGEKIDGRAGPRSENVVLQKTIDYIHELLGERRALLERLNRARCKLAPGHPALVPLQGVALWEREWTGGSGILDDASSDEEDDS